MTKDDCGPLWQLEANAKSNRLAAVAHLADAQRSQERADACNRKADDYEAAAAVLKAHYAAGQS